MRHVCCECEWWERQGSKGICRGGGAPRACIIPGKVPREIALVWPSTDAQEPVCASFKKRNEDDEG